MQLFGAFGFSYTGLVFCLCLFVHNIIWAKNRPVDEIVLRENRALLWLERIGQVLTTACLLLCADTNIGKGKGSIIWLVVAGLLMMLYEVCWVRYFRGGHTMADFYGPFLGISMPLATLPVTAVLALGLYSKSLALLLAGIILGIGHVGIHMGYVQAMGQRK